MVFSDTTNKNGLIQTCEFWCGFADAGISGNSTLLKQFTSRINSGFDRIMPRLLSYSDKQRWDDLNHTDLPVATFNIVSGQSDYQVLEDDNSLDILNITGVKILKSSSSTEYVSLERFTIDDDRAENAQSPNPTETGTPTHFLERNNTIFLYPKPNYSATSGAKIFFEREQSYFVSTDTTKEPGVPKPFHELLALYASHDWIIIHLENNSALVSRIEAQIATRERNLDDMIEKKNPQRRRMSPTTASNK